MQNAAAYLATVIDHTTGKAFAIGFFADDKKLAREHAEYVTRDVFPAARVTKVVRHSNTDPTSMGVFVAI